MNKYQAALIVYLSTSGQEFIDWLARQTDSKIVIMDDLIREADDFLDEKIKKELKAIPQKTDRHRGLTDILIDLHVKKNDKEFEKQFDKTVMGIFLRGKM